MPYHDTAKTIARTTSHGLIGLALMGTLSAEETAMDRMWGERGLKLTTANAERGQLLREGHYAMFIHWGLYSHLENRWQGKTYYGIGEWIMRMAKIPVADYLPIARDFNPVHFDAKAVARLAKDAGMKYIVITSKHHEGFAMFGSKASPFNIVDATPFKRDPLKELAEACHAEGLGFGFYYSQFLDWTTPGGGEGPATDAAGHPVDFDTYFRTKCLPQVEEITTNYGPIEIVWFDMPGSLGAKYSQQLVDTVHRNQPKAMVSGRVGNNLGDYQTLGDMEVPAKKVPGLWESVDTTNDSWAYAWYDENWKHAKEILVRLLSTNARGGTYMLNIGLKGDGSIPGAAPHLREAGAWIARHPQVVYGTEPSPWDHAQPWGDVVARGSTLYLCVYDWPQDGILRLHGLETPIATAEILDGAAATPTSATTAGAWTEIALPVRRPDTLIPVIRLTCTGKPVATSGHGLSPGISLNLSGDFAVGQGVTLKSVSWMEKFGEWKHQVFAWDWKEGSTVTWEVDVMRPGTWHADLSYAGKGRTTWKAVTDEGWMVQNNQNGSPVVHRYQLGDIRFATAGKHRISVTLLDGDPAESRLSSLHLSP